MKQFIFVLLCATLFSASPLSACRDDTPEQRAIREEGEKKRKEDWKKLSPEEREAKRKEIKTRLEKRIEELRSKETAGTISSQEKRELNRSEQILKRFEQEAAKQKRTNAPPRLN